LPGYAAGTGDPLRSDRIAANAGGFAVSVVMSLIGGSVRARCIQAIGSAPATAAATHATISTTRRRVSIVMTTAAASASTAIASAA
jgi:hypothetical protein